MEYTNYRLTIFPAIERSTESFSGTFATKELMLAASRFSSELLIALQDHFKVMPDLANAFFMEGFINGEWEEIEE